MKQEDQFAKTSKIGKNATSTKNKFWDIRFNWEIENMRWTFQQKKLESKETHNSQKHFKLQLVWAGFMSVGPSREKRQRQKCSILSTPVRRVIVLANALVTPRLTPHHVPLDHQTRGRKVAWHHWIYKDVFVYSLKSLVLSPKVPLPTSCMGSCKGVQALARAAQGHTAQHAQWVAVIYWYVPTVHSSFNILTVWDTISSQGACNQQAYSIMHTLQ